MVFIDVHCHLDFYKDDKKIDEVVKRAREKNVIMVCNGVGPKRKSNRKVLEIAEKYEGVNAGLGIYPIDALEMSDEEFDAEIEFIRENRDKIVAVGEVGIDLKESSDVEKQRENFVKLVNLACEIDKVLIVHSRKAPRDAIEVLEGAGAKKVIMHCFSGKSKFFKRILKNGWHFSVPTNVCYGEQMQSLARKIPIERILCETDSPYLHPERKRNNEPANVIEAYKKIAELKGMSLEDVEKQIEENYNRLFRS